MANKIHNTERDRLLTLLALATSSVYIFIGTYSSTVFMMQNFSLLLIVTYFITELFLRSTYRLLTHGEVLIIPNLFQPFLFGLLYFLIYKSFGPEHYHFTSPPQLWDWIQFTGAHILRAGDILDVIEEYKIDIQNVTHGSNFVATTIMAMHWMVDIFLLGFLWSLTKSWWEWLQYEEVQKLVYIAIAMTMLVFLITVFVQTATHRTSTLAFFINIVWISYHGLLMWPLDNIIRVIDVGDSFQLYQIRLHSVTINWWTSSLAVLFRLLISVPLAELINWIHLKYFSGVGKSIPELITDLANKNTRDAAIQGLARLENPATPALIKSLVDKDYDVRTAAVEALGKIGEPAIPDLVMALADKNSDIRKVAAKALGQIDSQWQQTEGAKVAIPNLANALANRYGWIREAAAKALGQIVPQWQQTEGAKIAILDLIKALVDKNSHVRLAAAEALNQIDPQWRQSEEAKVAIPNLANALANRYGGIREAAVEVLGQIGKPAIPYLTTALADKEWLVRNAAAEALSRIGEPAKVAIPDLVKALTDENSDVRQAAAKALDQIGELAIPYLATALEDEDHKVRQIAAKELGQIGESAKVAIPDLIKALADETWFVRQAAAKALGKIGEPAKDAIPALVKALANEDYHVHRAVAEALDKLDPQWRQKYQ